MKTGLQNHLPVVKLLKHMSNKYKIYGLDLDDSGRCRHYHSEQDIVALACAQCQQYFACYSCHDALRDHQFVPTDQGNSAILCGNCYHVMDFEAYSQNACPVCHHEFNPRCELHHAIYFK